MRDSCGMYTNAIEQMMTTTRPMVLPDLDSVRPKTRTETAAMAIPGTAITMSMTRMIASEKDLRTTAAIEPMIAPKKRAIRVEHRPIISENRPPYRTRAKMSRPTWSVPNRCSPDGALHLSKMSSGP